jgi:Protein of unknown function (DUF2723)
MGKRKSARGRGKRTATEGANDNSSLPASSDEPAAWARLAPFLASLLLAALYLATLYPSVAGGDSGELTAAALTGGVPHPSGYPLFALLARLFAALPLGHSPAWRVNLLSAVSTAAAAGLVCAVVHSWTRNPVAGLLAAALFGTNPLVWIHATSAEVFGLNAMFLALAFLLWSRVERTLSRREVFALLFASGLAMCNHHTFVFVGAPLVLRSLWVARRSLGASGIALALGIGLSGLLPYLYLMPASASAAAVSWGDETSMGALCAHVLRLNYGTFSMGRTGAQGAFVGEGTFLPTLWQMWGRAFPRLLWFGPVLAVTGIYLGIRRRPTRAAASTILFVFCFYSLTFCALSNLSTSRPHFRGILGRFCIESDLLLAIAAGLGLAALMQRLGPRSPWPRLLPAGVLLTFAVGVAVNAGQANARNNTVLRDFVTTAFASLPGNAIVITSMGDDVTGSAFYLHEVERLRPDVVHLDSDYLAKPWYTTRQRRLVPDVYLPEGGYGKSGWNIKQLLDGNPHRPLIFIGHLDDWDQSWKDGYKLATYGLIRSLVRASEFPTYQQWAEWDRQAIGAYNVAPALRAPEESWEMALGLRVLDTQVTRAHLALVYGYERGDPSDPARAALSLLEDVVAKSGGDEELAIAAWPGMPKLDTSASLWRNLSLAYQALSPVDDKYTLRFVIACRKFVNRANPNDPDLPAARKYLDETRAAPRNPIFNGRRAPIKSE